MLTILVRIHYTKYFKLKNVQTLLELPKPYFMVYVDLCVFMEGLKGLQPPPKITENRFKSHLDMSIFRRV